jgi:hypothetical protein
MELLLRALELVATGHAPLLAVASRYLSGVVVLDQLSRGNLLDGYRDTRVQHIQPLLICSGNSESGGDETEDR